MAVLNGVVLVSFIQDLQARGRQRVSAIVRGSTDRLRPVLMTATTSLLGLAPFLFATGPGSEVQRPLAVVVIGGLITCTPLTLIVLPVLYEFASDDKDEDDDLESAAEMRARRRPGRFSSAPASE
jgi:cobalt-zinc-cadmium resistance protein CzcA